MKTTRDSYSLGYATLAEGTNANTFKTTTACAYVINGQSYIKAATDNLAFSTGTAQAVLTQAAYFVFVDTAGTVTTVQSSIQPISSVAGYVAGAWEIPHVADKACIGAIKVTLASAATFTPGSTDLSATNVTGTYFNFGDSYGTPITY